MDITAKRTGIKIMVTLTDEEFADWQDAYHARDDRRLQMWHNRITDNICSSLEPFFQEKAE